MTGSRRRGAIGACLASAVLAGTLALTGCGFDVGGFVERQIQEIAGDDFDVTVGVGPTCLPAWVTYPVGEDSANQGMAMPDGEVCVSSWFVPRSTDTAQQLPALTNDSELAALAGSLYPLLAGQLPPGLGGILLGGGDLDELQQQLAAENVGFVAYGDGGRVLLVLTADGLDDDEMQLVIGAFCEGSC